MRITCPTCKKEFLKKHFVEHTRTHTDNKPFKCESCDKVFRTRANLTTHVNSAHLSKTFNCPTCKREFAFASLLSRHKVNARNTLPFPCDHCCSSFLNSSTLKLHLAKVHFLDPISVEGLSTQVVQDTGRLHKMKSKRKEVSNRVGEDSDDDRDFIPATQAANQVRVLERRKDVSNLSSIADRKRKLADHSLKRVSKRPLNSVTQLGETLDANEISKSQQSDVPVQSASQSTSQRSQSPLMFFENDDAPNPSATDSDGSNSPIALIKNTSSANAAETFDSRSLTAQLNDDYQHFNTPITSTAVPMSVKQNCDQSKGVTQQHDIPLHLDFQDTIKHGSASVQDPKLPCTKKPDNALIPALDQLVFTPRKRLLLDDFNDLFVLRTWRLSSSHVTLSTLKIEFPADDEPVMEPILWFLQGDRMLTTNEKLIAFLGNTPARITGPFIVGMMIADFSLHVPLNDLLQLYNSKDKVPAEYHQVLQTITILRIVRSFRLDLSNELSLDIIPEPLQDYIHLDFIIDLTNSNETMQQMKASFTKQEKDCIIEIIGNLTHLIFSSLEPSDCFMLDESFSYKDRSQTWTTLIPEYINGVVNQTNMTPFEIILLSEQKLRNGTLHFYNVKCGEQIIALHLHQHVVKKYCSSPFQVKEAAEASEKDVSTFINLLYRKYDVDLFKGAITLGVYRLACNLQISDVWCFLFRGNDVHQFISDDNKRDLFQIVIILRRATELEMLLNAFVALFHDHEQSKCINGLSQEDIDYLFKQKLHIDELEIYKMLIQWSFNQCDKICIDELSAKFDPDVYNKFLLVRRNLLICNLRKHFGHLARQKFITLQDIKTANTMALAQGGVTSSAPDPLWFAIESRGNAKI